MPRTIGSRRQKTNAGRFVGRFAEQQLFRATLRRLAALRDRHDEQLTDDELTYAQIFLIAAEGGMGKTTLLRRFVAIVEENTEGAGAHALYLDWDSHGPITDPDKLMRVLHDALCAGGFEREMQPYRDAIARRGLAQKKAADAEEQYKSLASFGGKVAQSASDGLLANQLVAEGIYAGAHELAELRAFIRKQLDSDMSKLYDDPDGVTEPFMEALNSIATPKRPLVLLLDTYELADRFDSWLRKRALPQSNPRLIWVLAGREGQPFIRRYEEEFGATLIGRILLDTFARPDIVAYLQMCGIATPDDQLIDRLQALSRGIPLALEGWFNLYQKNVELPPPDPTAPATRRDIVRAMTDRFLRYAEDDKRLTLVERRQREATRNHILTLMLLLRTDVDALAVAWQCSVVQAEATLQELAEQFSFLYDRKMDREPHTLVKEFLRANMRHQRSLPAIIQGAVTRLVVHFEGQLHEREHDILRANDSASVDGSRRPLWNDEPWRETLLNLVGALCWAEEGVEKVMLLLGPTLAEARTFYPNGTTKLLSVVEEFVDDWSPKYQQLFKTLMVSGIETNQVLSRPTADVSLKLAQAYLRWPTEQPISSQLFNLRQAVIYFRKYLEVYTFDTFPAHYIDTQVQLLRA